MGLKILNHCYDFYNEKIRGYGYILVKTNQ